MSRPSHAPPSAALNTVRSLNLTGTVNAPALIACLVAMFVVMGCGSTKVTSTNTVATGKLTRPGNILVYDFAATKADLPADSTLVGNIDDQPTTQTAKDIEDGRKVGAQIASELVTKIQALGMKATHATAGSKPEVNDLVIRGYLISVHEGSTAKRVAIGFGSGASELKTAVEGFQMTATGLRKLGSGTVNSGGSKGPGSVLGLATLAATSNPAGLIISSGVKIYGEASGKSKLEGRAEATAKEISEVLQKRFQDEGWID